MPHTRTLNRREHERFRLQPMYTSVAAAPADAPNDVRGGHAYDISETGVRIELDEAAPVGQCMHISLDLPGIDLGVGSAARVVWVNDAQDDPGPRRMALQFTSFDSEADHHRLVRYLGQGLQRVAA